MPYETDFQKFIEAYPPLNVTPASDEQIEKYLNVVPQDLLKLWKDYGFGTYGDGLIQIINPDEYRETLNMWLLRDDDGTRIPFAMSAFGNVFYWRHIFNPNPTEDIPEWVFDVSYFDPHTSENALCAYTMGEFFGDYLLQEFAQEILKHEFHSGFVIGLMEDDLNGHLDRNNSSLFARSIQKLGKLQPNEIYFFVPALRLGGIDDVEYVEKGNALVQLDILFQLAEGGGDGYDERYDYYQETDKLEGEPAKFDQRIDELKAEMDETNDVHNHYMIGMLLDEYPSYHENIQNAELVSRRTKQEALFHHAKAKELDPENPKYYYASFRSQISDFDLKNWDNANADLQKYYDLTGDEETFYRGKFDIAQMKASDRELLEFGEKLFEITGDYTDKNTLANYLSYQNQDKKMEIYRDVLENSFEFYPALTAVSELSDLYRNKKQNDDALHLFDELLEKFPENGADIYNRLAYFFKNDYTNKESQDKAVEYFKKAAEKAEENGADAYQIADYWFSIYTVYSENDFENAKSAIEKAIELNDNPYYQDEKARLLYKMGCEDEAKETFTNSGYSIQDFNKNFDENNWQEIVWSLTNSPKAFDIKIEKLQAELAENPNDAVKQFLLGKLFENYPTYELPSDTQENKQKSVAKSAFETFSNAKNLQPENAEYHYTLANFIYQNHFLLEMDNETRDHLMRNGYQFYIDHSENPAKGYEGLMWMAAYIDDYENVAKYAKLTYESDPEQIYFLTHAGNAYRQLGRFSDAMNAYQEYLQSATDIFRILEGKQGLAETYISMGEKDRAEKLIEELASSAENDGNRAEIYHTGAEAFRMRGDLQTAIKFQEKAVFFAEKADDVYLKDSQLYNLANLYEDSENRSEAIKIMQKVSASRGESYDFAYLGRLLKEEGRTDEAKNALNRALEMDPDDDYTKELLEDLGGKKKGGFFGKWF